GEMGLRKDMIDLFLETKDVLMDQVAAYRNQQEPSQEAYDRICGQLRALAEERHGAAPAAAAQAPAAPPPAEVKPVAAPEPAVQQDSASASTMPASTAGGAPMKIQVSRLKESDMVSLAAEMALMGDVLHEERQGDTVTFWLKTTTAEADILAVCCFIVNEDQVKVSYEPVPAACAAGAAQASAPAPAPVVEPVAPQAAAAAPQAPAAPAPAAAAQAPAAEKPAEKEPTATKPATKPAAKSAAA